MILLINGVIVKNKYVYFVEGETEKKMIETLKKEELIQAGRIEIFNVAQNKIRNNKLTLYNKKI